MSEKKICPKCNSVLDGNVNFCTSCGTKLIKQEAPASRVVDIDDSEKTAVREFAPAKPVQNQNTQQTSQTSASGINAFDGGSWGVPSLEPSQPTKSSATWVTPTPAKPTEPAKPAQPARPVQPAKPMQPAQPPKKKSKLPIIIGVVLVCFILWILIMVGILWLIFKGGSDDKNNDTETRTESAVDDYDYDDYEEEDDFYEEIVQQEPETQVVSEQPVVDETGEQDPLNPVAPDNPAQPEQDETYVVQNGDFLFPDSDSRYISESELYSLTAEQCRIARNEIYARRGYIFKKDEMISYFNSKSWYTGIYSDQSTVTNMFNQFESKNVKTIKDYEKSMGY